MSDERPSDVLGALPRTRPHRRSDKRATRPEKDRPVAAVTPEALDAVQPAVAASDAAVAQPKAKPKPAAAAKTKAKPAAAAKAKPKPPAAVKAKPTAARASAKPTGARADAKPGPRAKAAPSADAARTRLAAPPAKPARSRRNEALSTAVQAAAELAEIGLTASARVIRRAVSRLPRP